MDQVREPYEALTIRSLAVFWAPLALMWILMAIEQPAINGLIARLPNAAIHLAGFEVAFGLALVIESPIIQMLSAGTALTRGRESYRGLLRFMHGIGIGLTLIHIVVAIPPVFAWVSSRLLQVPPEVQQPAWEVFVLLVLFSPLVGYRRLWQGALIRVGQTAIVARIMVIRLIVTVLALVGGMVWYRRIPDAAPGGHVLAAGALIAGIAVGAAAAWWYARRVVEPALAPDPPGTTKTLRDLVRFYVPLSLTSIMLLVSRPVLAFGIGRSALPLLSLAAWPVVQSVLFMFTSIALSYQEAVVAKYRHDSPDTNRVLVRFGLMLGVSLSLLFLIAAASGLAEMWYRSVAGIDGDLVALAIAATTILVAMPLVVTLRSFVSGVLVSRERMGLLSAAVGANTAFLVLGVMFLPQVLDRPGTSVAAIAFLCANLAQLTVLWIGYLGRRNSGGVSRA